MKSRARGETTEGFLRAARVALNAFVIAGAALPLYLLAKQSVTPELETFAWPPHWTGSRTRYSERARFITW